MFYAAAFKNFWWLLVLCLAAHVYVFPQQEPHIVIFFMWLAVWYLCLFSYYLFIRPSLQKKNMSYMLSYLGHAIWFCWTLFFVSLSEQLCNGIALLIRLGQLQSLWNGLWALLYGFNMLVQLPILLLGYVIPALEITFIKPVFLIIPLLPFFSFFVFFLLDGTASIGSYIKSLYRAVLMLLYNLPASVLLTVVLLTGYSGLQQYVLTPAVTFTLELVGSATQPMIVAFVGIFSLLLIPIGICIWSTLYTKKVHEQFSLYCGKQC